MPSEPPYPISPRIWFGGEAYTHSPECHLNITHILNVCCEETATAKEARETAIECLWIYNRDEPEWPILGGRFKDAVAFLDRVLSESPHYRVYIHCHEGINRSAAVAIAYRCGKTGESAASILAEVRATGRRVLTNDGFEAALLHQIPTGTV